jgi:drug/metabolite transporter (DMT)-like permease
VYRSAVAGSAQAFSNWARWDAPAPENHRQRSIAGGGLLVPASLAEWLGVLGGMTFALNNVLLKREAHQPDAARALAMFLGGSLVAGVLALGLGAQGSVPWPPPLAAPWLVGATLMSVWFLLGNLSLQYGAARLPAHVTAVVMITEVLFAAVSALALGAGTLSTPLLVGGSLIVGATLLSARGTH